MSFAPILSLTQMTDRPLNPQQARMVRQILDRQVVTIDQMIDQMWTNPDLLPEFPGRALRAIRCQANTRLKQGFRIQYKRPHFWLISPSSGIEPPNFPTDKVGKTHMGMMFS